MVGLVSYGASIALFVVALRKLGAPKTSALFAIAPVTGVSVAWMMLSERPQWLALVGGGVMIATIVLIALTSAKAAE